MKRDLPFIEYTPLPEARELPDEFGWRMWERACRELDQQMQNESHLRAWVDTEKQGL